MSTQVLAEKSLSCIRLEPAPSVTLFCKADRWTIARGAQSLSFRLPQGRTAEVLEQIRDGGAWLEELERKDDRQEPASAAALQIGRLWRQGLLIKSVYDGDARVAVLHNFGEAQLLPGAFGRLEEVSMAEDSCVRPSDGALLIESAACGAYLLAYSERLQRLPLPWVRPMTCKEWADQTDLPEDVICAIASCLESIGALVRTAPGKGAGRRPTGWSFADQMSHARSRLGRHIGEYGVAAEYPGRPESSALLPEVPGDAWIDLPRPAPEDIAAKDRPFTEVLEGRRSIREHHYDPPSVDNLSEFLFRAARVTGRVGSEESGITLRPYPSGGGLHELVLYPLVDRCDGLRSGLYRYDAHAHRLLRIAEAGPTTLRLLEDARRSARMTGNPHILMLIAATFATVQAKYRSMAYSLILKNAGCLLQTMHLVASAMDLAGCILGGGGSDTFCQLTGTDYWQESIVGEFILGRRSLV